MKQAFWSAACLTVAAAAQAETQTDPPTEPDLPPLAARILEVALTEGDAQSLPVAIALLLGAEPDTAPAIEQFLAMRAPDRADLWAGFFSPDPAADPKPPMPETLAQTALQTFRLGFFNPRTWDGEIGFGGALLTGNTQEQALNSRLNANRRVGLFEHDVNFLGEFARNQEVVTQQRLQASYGVRGDLGERVFLLGRVGAELDNFGEFTRRLTQTVGLGYRIFEREQLNWLIEGGPGSRQTQFADGTSATEIVGRLSSVFAWTFGEGAEFTHRLDAFGGTNTSTLESEFAVTAKLTERFSGRASFFTEFDTGVPEDLSNLDTATRASLVFNY
ncbi:MAG: YdiY family protein [Maricaulaceae bacterium]